MPGLAAPGDVPWTSIDTSTAASTMLANILTSDALDEISNYPGEDGEDSAIKRYMTSAGRVREGKLTRGIIFWVYPTGRHGPTETLEEGDLRGTAGTVLLHGLLVTLESGADVEEATRRIFEAVPESGIVHLHVQAADRGILEDGEAESC
ncbi:hypothetical protein DFH07DRAFT_857426 [Mycena maculata]|uniref:Uncharacterized protein n=1 Tax=Mycena maculata TaxID=230809 RepID=A0AAD7HJ19_9AGAR|nr:hypothetical protein DFH07DRAFT_857426 [Mycena maculata]